MANVFPPFKIDIAGAFCVPRALKDVREQYSERAGEPADIAGC